MTSAGGTLFRRITSFFIDILAIAMFVNLSFNFLAGPIIQDEIGYEEGMLNGLVAESDEYTSEREDYQARLEEDNNYTQTDYEADIEALDEEYNARNNTAMLYIYWVIIYHWAMTTVLYYVYSVIMKGQTFGRRFTKLYLSGKVNWWTLLIREVLWKFVFWVFIGIFASSIFSFNFLFQSFLWVILLPIGIWIDIFMILSTRNKKTLRDRLSGTRILLKDIIYPF